LVVFLAEAVGEEQVILAVRRLLIGGVELSAKTLYVFGGGPDKNESNQFLLYDARVFDTIKQKYAAKNEKR
jgi:hypothetical protein